MLFVQVVELFLIYSGMLMDKWNLISLYYSSRNVLFHLNNKPKHTIKSTLPTY